MLLLERHLIATTRKKEGYFQLRREQAELTIKVLQSVYIRDGGEIQTLVYIPFNRSIWLGTLFKFCKSFLFCITMTICYVGSSPQK